MFVLAYTVGYSQTTLTSSSAQGAYQYPVISADEGIVIHEQSDLTLDYKVFIATYGWELNSMPEVISYFEGQDKLNVIEMIMDEDNKTLLIKLLEVPGVNDSWGFDEWNNHLNTIK